MTRMIIPALLLALSCSDFNDRYPNIIPGVKTRPFSIVCDPPEAAPGDTVQVTLFVYTPDPSAISFGWQAALDYRIDNFGSQESENDIVDLTPLMTGDTLKIHADNLVEYSFRFRVPDSVLINASSLPERFPLDDLPADMKTSLGIDPAAASLSRAGMDSLLRGSAFDVTLLPDPALQAAVSSMVDFFTAPIRLRADVNCEIDLEVTKQLTVRYSRPYNTPGVNVNPRISWMGIIRVDRDITALDRMDDIGGYDNDTVTIYDAAAGTVPADSVIIDTGASYFAAVRHDSQTYVAPSGAVYYEEHFFDWFGTNLDPSPYSQDSLLMVMGSFDLAMLLPPVDTDMDDFLIYVVLRDYRPEWGTLVSTGADYAWGRGRFHYTPAYRRKYQHLQD